MSKKSSKNIIWIDLEMTGLTPETDRIIEIATIVTDLNLNVLAEGPVFAIHQSEDVLGLMNKWNQDTHGASGLIERVRQSSITETDAENQTLEFLKQFIKKGRSPMAGNSICQDRRFLYNYMPKLEAFFHYRNLDVSTLKELAMRWAPKLIDENSDKNSTHQALDDIRGSIDELRYYREHFIKLPE